jgi:hypothetical protein
MSRQNLIGAALVTLLLAGGSAARAAQASSSGHATPAAQQQLTPKESFMLMFGKGNGAMRLLCALQKEGLIDQATRLRWATRLDALLSERGDSDEDRRNARLGMAFADARASLCPGRVMGRTDP